MKVLNYLLTLILLAGLPLTSAAQTDGRSFYEQYQLEIVLGVAALVCLLALVALLTALMALRAVLRLSNPAAARKEAIPARPGEEGVGFWRRLWNRLNDSVPVAQENSVMTNHEYDGIRELDNKLPPWWLYGFYATIIFAVGYLLHFHVFKTGDLQAAEYEKEMAQAKAQVEAYLAATDVLDETNVTFAGSEADLAAGKQIFISQCAACHGQDGEGGIGPNFADKYWVHGGDIKSIFKTVKYGVPEKGMIPWQSQLSPEEMQQVSSYIYTLEGTDPPNQKDPEGELFEREDMETSETDAEESEVDGA